MKSDFDLLVKENVRGMFPERDVAARQEESWLHFCRSGAADDLAQQTAANPGTIGTTVKTRALLADDADLYLKGIAVSRLPRHPATTRPAAGADREKNSSLTGDVSQLAAGANHPCQCRGATALPAWKRASPRRRPSAYANHTHQYIRSRQLGHTVHFRDAGSRPAHRRHGSRVARSPGDKGVIEKHFAWRFFTSGDSREPELAGLRGAIIGSLLTVIMTLALSVPLGIAAAVYLEEFAAKNKWTELIEVNINNLAAVPSIIFGLLGLAVFINFFGLPRSAPLVGGLVLGLLVLPTIIIATRAALKAVPPSIKEAALGVGASHQQAVFHHVLPLAVPGILTGTILGVARALGETAPLLMIGMVAFIVDVPKGFTEAATVLPVQIYLWSDLPEVAFQSRTAAAIIVLLVILFCLNAVAIYIRKRFEKRW